jgi:hypothetical protein
MDQLIAIAVVGCLAMTGLMMATMLRSNRAIGITDRDESRLLLAEIDKLNPKLESKPNDATIFGQRIDDKIVANRTLPADEPWPPRLM